MFDSADAKTGSGTGWGRRTDGGSGWRLAGLPWLVGVCLLGVLAGVVTLSPGQDGEFAPTPFAPQSLPAEAPASGPGLPIHTLPSTGFQPFVFPAPRDYQAGGVTVSFSDLEPPAGNPREPLPAPMPAPMQGIDWEQATPVDLEPTEEAATVNCSPFGEFFYMGAGDGPQDNWLVGSGDRMGIFSLVTTDDDQYVSLGWLHFDLSTAIHFISGPVRTDLPPRVYDFTFDFPYQGTIGDEWSYDVRVRVGWFSDFEDSARDAIRFPSHAVVYRRVSECWQWVLGIDYLDRDDVSLLPVGGALWTPSEDWRIEAIFPKPLVAYRFRSNRWFYVASEMGGGTWDIERVDGTEDIFTYRDFRILFGLQGSMSEQDECIEVGYVFGRHLEYRSGTPDYSPPDTILLRSVKRY